jgi:hypothetical protein
MPEKSHTNPQVTIDHAEYQELLEAQKALDHLTEDDHKEGKETKVIHQYTAYHSKNNYDTRDHYLIANPNDLTKILIAHCEENQKMLKEIMSTIGRSYDLPSGSRSSITHFLKELNAHVGPKTK